MKTMLVSNDKNLIRTITRTDFFSANQLILISNFDDPLDIMSTVCSDNPGLLIADDDLLQPNSARILRSIKKVKDNIYIIFITSDSSISLGREVSQLGIQFYALKPLDENDLIESVKSIARLKEKKNNFDRI